MIPEAAGCVAEIGAIATSGFMMYHFREARGHVTLTKSERSGLASLAAERL
jgi:predicted ribonuclease YlaK